MSDDKVSVKEALEKLYDLSWMVGSTAMEYLTDKDGEKIRDHIGVIEDRINDLEKELSEFKKYFEPYDIDEETAEAINEIKGNLVGNGYTIRTYDNYGSKVMTTTGDKINIQGNPVKTTSYSSDGSVVTGYEMSSVITINIDGKEIQSCGDTCIFEQDGLQPDVDFVQTDIYSQSTGKLSDNTYVAGIVNKYKNYFGKSRVVVIKSQLGQPIVAYSGDEVYWKIPKDLPKMTKLMIDGKALYIHRANFQIIDTALLD